MCNIQKLNSLDVMHYWFKLKCSAHITLCGISYSMPVHFLLYAENSKLSSFWGSWTHVKCHQMKLYAAFSKWITVKRGNMSHCLTGLTQYPPLDILTTPVSFAYIAQNLVQDLQFHVK